jgi:hypothetical protein
MAANTFNLVALYQSFFKITGKRFAIPSLAAAREQSSGFDTLQTLAKPTAKALSILGTPIYEQINFKIPLANGGFRDYLLPDWPLLDVNVAKNIVKTPIKGKNGTVKEYINIDDYQITIRGIIINYTSEAYPEDLVNDLHQLFVVNKEMQVTSALLNLLDIHNVVITDLKLPEVEGYNNIQPYIISCISDEPVELLIQDARNQNRIIQGL